MKKGVESWGKYDIIAASGYYIKFKPFSSPLAGQPEKLVGTAAPEWLPQTAVIFRMRSFFAPIGRKEKLAVTPPGLCRGFT